MMNYPDAAADPWRCCYNNAGQAAAAPVPTSGETGSFFADMVPDYSTDDLSELVWEQEGQDGGAGMMQPVVSRLRSPRFSKPPDVRFEPPSEDEMAAWLSAIVKGDELACNEDGGRRPMADDGRHVATVTNKENVSTTEGKMGTKEMRKAPAGGSSRRSHHGEAHNLTEKRRRNKINERLKTLQQLVPGCSKSNQASTLDQTIHYMKSLQHQVQAMSVGLALAVYPVMQPQCVPPATPVAMPFPAAPMFLGGHPPSTTMVPLRTTIIPLPRYPAAAVMMPAAAVAPLYPAAAPTSTAVAPGDPCLPTVFMALAAEAAAKEAERAVAACARVTEPDHYQNTRYDVETPGQEGRQIVDVSIEQGLLAR